ncbi:MAG TPA: M23 family metallopeptidase [Oscillatoriaceae cyanobacterium]
MRPLHLALVLSTIAGTAVPAIAADKPVTIQVENRSDGGLNVWACNTAPGDATVDLDLDLQGLVARTYLHTTTVPADSKVLMATLNRTGRTYRWYYHYYTEWGRADAAPQNVVYKLPFNKGTSSVLGQGYFGSFSHQNTRALDFTLPEGATVRAARAGVVVATEAGNTQGGPDRSYAKFANYVLVEQSDGTIAAYYHFCPDGVLVRAGQRVEAGDALGYAGHTGMASGPHVHFEVDVPIDGRHCRTIDTRFEADGGVTDGTTFQQGEAYLAE